MGEIKEEQSALFEGAPDLKMREKRVRPLQEKTMFGLASIPKGSLKTAPEYEQPPEEREQQVSLSKGNAKKGEWLIDTGLQGKEKTLSLWTRAGEGEYTKKAWEKACFCNWRADQGARW